MLDILEKINTFIWGVPALLLTLIVGIHLSLRTGFLQIRLLPHALAAFLRQFRLNKNHNDSVSPYQALCTALAATVGTGNLAGVAGAISIGGPGAIFWMWACGVLGMMTKFAEATLAIRYRQKSVSGEYYGGPMYMIRNGLGRKWSFLAFMYAFFGIVASFGVGNATQINTVVGSLNSTLALYGVAIPRFLSLAIGCVLAAFITVLLSGGAKRIGAAAERIVPVASVIYIFLCIGVLAVRFQYIPQALSNIVIGAFNPKAVTGGMLGSGIVALRTGASRGVFTNEAGMGTAAIAHSAAKVSHPAEQGMMGIIEVFVDTIVICTMTALVILCSGIPIPYGTDAGVGLTTNAFSEIYGDWVSVVITVAICSFAIATILGWGLYGVQCAQFLFGKGAGKWFLCLQAAMVMIGAVLQTETAWLLSEIVNGLMSIPNLLAIAMLSPELFRLINEYKLRLTKGSDAMLFNRE